ncbi:MAG: hypothetical protein QM656_11455 [Paracoccaceae bacterium]
MGKVSLKLRALGEEGEAGIVADRPPRQGTDLGVVLRTLAMVATPLPRFPSGAEPLRDGVALPDADGANHARPDLAPDWRGGAFPGPDVLFLKELDGTIRLHIGLEERLPPGVPAGTRMLGGMRAAPRIVWAGGSFQLPDPTPDEDTADGTRRLRILARLSPAEVAALFAAMTDPAQSARIEADYTADYIVLVSQTPPHRRPWRDRFRLPPEEAPSPFGSGVRPVILNAPRLRLETRILAPAVPMGPEAGSLPLSILFDDAASARQILRLRPDVIEDLRHRLPDQVFLPDTPAGPEEVRRSVTFRRSIPFFFDRALDQNAAIFRAITGGTALPGEWQDTEWGTLRPSDFVNTIHLLPHEIRLSYDAGRGLPHMTPVLYQTDAGAFRLRVILRAEPWYDPAQVRALRAALSRQTAGGYVHPSVIGGGVAAARLTLRSVFPEEIAAEAEGAEIDLRRPFELTLDVSEEYYSLLVATLTGPSGLTGSVEAVLRPAADGAAAETRLIPVALSFRRPGLLPVEAAGIEAAINPDSLRVTNRTGQPVTIEEAAAVLLQLDTNALTPREAQPARCTSALPLTLEPGAETVLTFAPAVPEEGAVWNGLDPALTRLAIALDPQAALKAIHALAPAGAFGWRLRILAPQLQADQSAVASPDRLLAVEVAMERPAAPSAQITLMAGDGGDVTLTLPRNLDDLAGAATAAEFLTARVRARGVLASGFGPWSDWADHRGATLFVFAPPAGGTS